MPMLPRRSINSLLHHIKGFVDRHPRLLARLRMLAYRLGLEDAARGLYARLTGSALYFESFRQHTRLPHHADGLPPHARRIYQDIKTAIDAQRKDHT